MGIRCDPAERKYGSHRFDWILAHGPDDRMTSPKAMRTQIVPVKANRVMRSEVAPDTSTDDLSDHYGVIAQLYYGKGPFPHIRAVQGHRGTGRSFPGTINRETLAKLLAPMDAPVQGERKAGYLGMNLKFLGKQ